MPTRSSSYSTGSISNGAASSAGTNTGGPSSSAMAIRTAAAWAIDTARTRTARRVANIATASTADATSGR